MIIPAGFIRCYCGKLHEMSGITLTSSCSCGNGLWWQLTDQLCLDASKKREGK